MFKDVNKCPNCGNEIPAGEYFCPVCGMRVNVKEMKAQDMPFARVNERKDSSFRDFDEWCDYWADLYVRNVDYWRYLISEHFDDEEWEYPLFVCAHEFASLNDMQEAYICLCDHEKDMGYGFASSSIMYDTENLRWYVLLDCADLPLVLMVGEYHGKLCGWADYFIQMPPLPIYSGKSIKSLTYKGQYAPVKKKRQFMDGKDLFRKATSKGGLKFVDFETKKEWRSSYIFIQEIDYNKAKEAIWNGNRVAYDKLNWYGDTRSVNGYDVVWRVDL